MGGFRGILERLHGKLFIQTVLDGPQTTWFILDFTNQHNSQLNFPIGVKLSEAKIYLFQLFFPQKNYLAIIILISPRAFQSNDNL